MKKKFFLFLIFCLLSYITNNIISISKKIEDLNNKEDIFQKKIKRNLKSVVKISYFVPVNPESKEDSFEAKESGVATGFSIKYKLAGHKTIILTNDHFCEGLKPYGVLLLEDYLGENTAYLLADLNKIIIKKDYDLDLCALEIDGLIMPAELMGEGEKLGMEVLIIGSPNGVFPIITKAYISRVLSQNKKEEIKGLKGEREIILISDHIYPGHSGSPLFAESGKIAGIVYASTSKYGGLAIGSEDIREFIKDL